MTRYVPPGPLGMGGAPLGNLFDRIPEPVAAATVEAAWDAGIRHYDTPPITAPASPNSAWARPPGPSARDFASPPRSAAS